MRFDPLTPLGLLGIALLTTACGWDAAKKPAASNEPSDAGTNDASDAAPTDAADGAPQESACRTSELGKVTEASPLVSVGKRVAASDGVLNPEAVVDGRYHGSTSAALPEPTPETPAWISIEIGAGPERLLLVWTDPGWTPYNVLTGGAPTAYRIETSGDSSDGIDGTWDEAVPETTNAVRSRGNSFDFSGKSWVRLVVTGVAEGMTASRIDEIAVHDVSAAGTDARPTDTWIFLGDSITQGGVMREFGANAVDAKVHEARPDYYPAVINAGIGGELTAGGLARLDALFEANPDFFHVGILYGTNDSWGNKDPVATHYAEQLSELVQRVLDSGRVPFVATIPFSTVEHGTLPAYNAVIESVIADKGLPCGPDFYAWFRDHPDELSGDGVHPNSQGYRSMNALWAETLEAYYPPAE